MKIKKIFKYVMIILLAYITVYTCNRLITQKQNKEIDRYLYARRDVMQTIAQMQKRLPINAGDSIMLNKLEYINRGNLFVHYYKLPVEANIFTDSEIKAYKDVYKRQKIKTMKNNPNNTSFVEVGVNFQYIFLDKNDKEIFRFRVNIDDYK